MLLLSCATKGGGFACPALSLPFGGQCAGRQGSPTEPAARPAGRSRSVAGAWGGEEVALPAPHCRAHAVGVRNVPRSLTALAAILWAYAILMRLRNLPSGFARPAKGKGLPAPHCRSRSGGGA